MTIPASATLSWNESVILLAVPTEVIWLSNFVTFKHLKNSDDIPNLYVYIKCLILAAVHIPYNFGILVLAISAVLLDENLELELPQ